MVEHLVHVDAFSVEDHLLLASLAGAVTEEAARQATGLHDDGVLGQRAQDRRQVKVHLAQRQDQLHLVDRGGFFSLVMVGIKPQEASILFCAATY